MSFYFPKANTIPGIRTSFSRAPSPSFFTFFPPDSTEWLRSRFLDVRGAVSNLRHSMAYIIFAAKLSAFFGHSNRFPPLSFIGQYIFPPNIEFMGINTIPFSNLSNFLDSVFSTHLTVFFIMFSFSRPPNLAPFQVLIFVLLRSPVFLIMVIGRLFFVDPPAFWSRRFQRVTAGFTLRKMRENRKRAKTRNVLGKTKPDSLAARLRHLTA